jgi:hypothetical protein
MHFELPLNPYFAEECLANPGNRVQNNKETTNLQVLTNNQLSSKAFKQITWHLSIGSWCAQAY